MRWAGHSMRSIAAVLLTSLFAGCGPPVMKPADVRNDSPAQAIDVVELSAVDARDRMAAGTLTSRALTQALLDKITADRRRGSDAECGDRGETPRRSPMRRRWTPSARPARFAARFTAFPILIKDNIDVCRHGELGRLARACRYASEAGRVHRRAPARGRCGDSRQDEPQRVGQLPLDAIDIGLELARRPNQEPVCPRSQPVRLELGHRNRNRGEPGVDRRRHRDRRQHPVPPLRSAAWWASSRRSAW